MGRCAQVIFHSVHMVCPSQYPRSTRNSSYYLGRKVEIWNSSLWPSHSHLPRLFSSLALNYYVLSEKNRVYWRRMKTGFNMAILIYLGVESGKLSGVNKNIFCSSDLCIKFLSLTLFSFSNKDPGYFKYSASFSYESLSSFIIVHSFLHNQYIFYVYFQPNKSACMS